MAKYKVSFKYEVEVEASNEENATIIAMVRLEDGIQTKEDDFVVNKIKDTKAAVILEPGKLARVQEIENDLKSLQEIIGGRYEVFYYADDSTTMICSEDALLNGLPLNRQLVETNEIIAGTAIILGNDFSSLEDWQVKKYLERYKYPQHFTMMNGKVLATRYEPKA